jgi:hypothetical protein
VTRVLDTADPARGEEAGEFQGDLLGASVSVIVVDAPTGGGPRLHRHPYKEVFVVQEGSVTFPAGDDVIEATGSQVVVVPTALALFPRDITRPPRELAERFFDVHCFTEMQWGGHFDALEVPDAVAADIRAFAADAAG